MIDFWRGYPFNLIYSTDKSDTHSNPPTHTFSIFLIICCGWCGIQHHTAVWWHGLLSVCGGAREKGWRILLKTNTHLINKYWCVGVQSNSRSRSSNDRSDPPTTTTQEPLQAKNWNRVFSRRRRRNGIVSNYAQLSLCHFFYLYYPSASYLPSLASPIITITIHLH